MRSIVVMLRNLREIKILSDKKRMVIGKKQMVI